MATAVPPPPKRIKLDYAKHKEAQLEGEEPQENVIVQFTTPDGLAIGPSISLSSDTDHQTLELLGNSLQETADEPLPFDFQIALNSNDDNTPSSLPVDGTLRKTLKEYSNLISTEQILVINCTPQAVFRVREVTRCSSALDGHTGPILCASFSPTGKMLATGGGDNTARLWDLDIELPKHTLTGHKGWVLCVEWDGLERFVATGSMDNNVRLFDPKTGLQSGDDLRGHAKWITSLSWEPVHAANLDNGPRLASSSKDGTVKIWLPKVRRAEFTLGGHSASVNVVKWGGENVIYTASSDRTVKLWDAREGKLIRTLSEHAHWVNTLALSTDFILRTGPYDHKGKQPASDAEAREAALERYQKAISKNPEQLISGSDDHTLFLWPPIKPAPANPKKPVARLTGHQKQVNHVAFSPDGAYIASAGFDNAVKLWEGRTGKFIATFRGHVGAVYRVSWSSDSRMLVSASKDSTLKLWDLKTHKIRVDLPGHTDEVFCVDFVADKVASGGRDKKLRIWRH